MKTKPITSNRAILPPLLGIDQNMNTLLEFAETVCVNTTCSTPFFFQLLISEKLVKSRTENEVAILSNPYDVPIDFLQARSSILDQDQMSTVHPATAIVNC